MWHAVLPMCSCCVEVKKGQLICCEESVSLGNGENAESEGRAAWQYATGFPRCGFALLYVG